MNYQTFFHVVPRGYRSNESLRPINQNQNQNQILFKLKIINNIEVDNCAICLEQMEINKYIYQTICKHKFHKNCLEHFIIHKKYNISCPLCRSNI